MKLPFAAFAVGCALVATSAAQTSNLTIVQSVLETRGTTTDIPGSGTKENTDVWNTGVVGRFLVSDGLNTYGLQVEASNPTGALLEGADSLMVARTTNSQGLTDAGTLSVYVNNRPANNATTTAAWALDLRFTFWDPTFTAAQAVTILLTSLDIDHNQRYYTDSSDFVSNSLYANSAISSSSAVGTYTGFTAAGDSVFNDPKHAGSSLSRNQSAFDVKIAHSEVALYMFEFRSPSQIVPEPSAALLGMMGLSALLLRRR